MSDSAHKPAAAYLEFSPAACAEFPSDNPALHQGAVWLCTWTRAYPRAVRLASAARPSELGAGAGLSGGALTLNDAVTSQRADVAPEALPLQDEPAALLEHAALQDEPADAALLEQVTLEAPLLDELALQDEPPDAAQLDELASPEPALLEELALQDEAPAAPLLEEVALQDHDASEPLAASDATDDVNLWQPLAPAVLTLSDATGFSSEDPFVLGLRALVACGEDSYEAPPTITQPAEALTANNAAEESSAALSVEVEPLTLEGFLSGVSVAQSDAIAPVQPLCALDLDLDELSPQDTAWQDLVKGLCNFLMAQGSSRAAILLPALLQGEAVNLTRLPRTVIECLLAEGIAVSSHDSVTVSPQFRARARGLHHAFGSARLDAESLSGWVAGLVHALLASSQDVAAVLQQLHAAVPTLATLGKPAPALRSA